MIAIRSLFIINIVLCATHIASAQVTWTFDGTPADILMGSGQHSLAGCDINGDSFTDLIVGSQGYVFVFHGSSTGYASSPNRTLSGSGSFGAAVACGHVNNDIYADVIVGDYTNFVVRAYLGSSAGVNSTSSFTVLGIINSNFGVSLTCCDFNGDGYDDLAVGATNYANGQTNEGAVYIYYASSSGIGLTITGNVTIEGNDIGAQFGNLLTCGPINGDSYSDLVVGAPSAVSASGRVDVYLGSASGIQTTTFWNKNGTFTGNKFGSSISARGDVNKDGINDLAIASYQLVEIYLGNSTLKTTADASYTFPVTDTLSCALVPDTNKDLYDDILIGEPLYGRARLFRGGNLPLSNTTVYLYTSGTGNGAGSNVYGMGDVDGDLGGDIALTDPLYATNDGRVTVVRQLAPSASPTPSVTPSNTPSPSVTPSITPSASASASVTPTASATASVTPSVSPSPSASRSATPSRSPSRSPIPPSPSATPGACLTPPNIISCGNACFADPADCVTPSPCPDTFPFKCSDGSCADSASGCNETLCGSLVLCWDGNCATTLQDCAPVPACPSAYPLRCWNGCFTTNYTCDTLMCPGQVGCTDGSCVNTESLCPEYNGCPLGTIECPSGSCVTLSTDCECRETGQTGLYQCFESGCSNSCKLPPWKVKPATYIATVIATSAVDIPLTDTDGNSIGQIHIQANSFSNTVLITITSVPDSVILGSTGVLAIVAPAISLEVNSGQTFSTPIQICFDYILPDGTTVDDLSDACLMTLASSGNWECHSDVTIDGTSICGNMTHFSEWSFGILKQSKDKASDSGLPMWALIVIIVGGAVVLGAIITLIVVLIMKNKRRKEEYEMY